MEDGGSMLYYATTKRDHSVILGRDINRAVVRHGHITIGDSDTHDCLSEKCLMPRCHEP